MLKTVPMPSASNIHPSELPQHVQVLLCLGACTGNDAEKQRTQIAVLNASSSTVDPISLITEASHAVGVRISRSRQPLEEAVWHAKDRSPVVLWIPAIQGWIVVTNAGVAKLRVILAGDTVERFTCSLGDLCKKIGVSSPADVVEFGIAQATLPLGRVVLDHDDDPVSQKSKGAEDHSASHGHRHHMSPARRFLNLIVAEREEVKLLLIFSIFYGLLHLAAPLAVDAVMSNLAFGAQQKPYLQAIIVLSIALCACLALQAVISGFQHYLAEVLQRRIFVRVASELAHRLPRVKAEMLDRVHAPELVNRFLEVATAQKNSALLLLDGVNLVFGGLIGMLLLALYHPLLLAFVALMIVSIAVVLWIFGGGAVKTSIEESVLKYDLVHWFEQVAAFPFLFKSKAGSDLAYDKTNEIASRYLDARTRHFAILMRQISGLLLIEVLASAVLLGLGGWLVVGQQLTMGQLVASELIMTSVVASLAKIGKKLEAWYDAMAAMDKLGHILDLDLERDSGEHPAAASGAAPLELHGVRLDLDGTNSHSREFTFSAMPGARVSILAESGMGAGVLLDAIFGLRSPAFGNIQVDGLDLRSWNLEALRSHVKLVRVDEIINGTIIENLRLGRSDIGIDEVIDSLKQVGLLDDVLALPAGLDTELKIGGGPLSSAQRIRLMLARGLAQRPRLLLIDGLLDAVGDRDLDELTGCLMSDSNRATTILVTRHEAVAQKMQQTVRVGVATV
jgi:ABC-type bacteriocin/lantibiotic exporter with double-glycine peptidase domain